MKKIFFALATIAALASCSKSEVEYEQTSEITFTPVTKNITKSMITGTTFPTTESFNVWAWYNQVPAETTPADWNKSTDNLYVTKGEFVRRGETSDWGGATPYYWPKVGSLLFAGYYHSVDNDVEYTFTDTENKMVFTDIQQRFVGSSGYSEDLMYFNMTPKSYKAGPVPVVFKHALSWVTVSLKQSDFTVTGGFPKITVHKVDFTNVNPKGTGTVTGTDGTIAWVVNGTIAETTVTTGDVVLTTTDQMLKQPLFIPQALTYDDPNTTEVEAPTMALKINYTIASSATESFTETLTVPLAGMVGETPSATTPGTNENVTISSWDPAKHYVYNVVMGLEEILIEPTVADWTPVTIAMPL